MSTRHQQQSFACPRLALLAGLSLAAWTLAGCAASTDDPPTAVVTVDDCGSPSSCDDPVAMSEQVRKDAEAMLAGIAHARERLGLQEDATP
jgi:hypothetical protein